MKFFVIIAAVISATVAEYAHHYPIHIPVIGPKGVPLEPAEVVHARHAHLSHVAAHQGHYGGLGYAGAGHAGAVAYGAGPAYYGGHVASVHYPVIGPHGVPHDTPEVQHAKAEHFALYAKAAAAAHAAGPDPYAAHYRKRRSIYGGHLYNQHVPVIGHGGVPLDTPEVAAAKAAHFAEHAKVGSGYHGLGHQSSHIAVGGYGHYHGPYPELDHDGRPIETHEVQALKHAHFAAHAEAKARAGHHGYGAPVAHYAAPVSHYGAGVGLGHYGGHYGGESRHVGAYHIPVIDHNGVPVETPEVIAAKKHHYAALAEASARAGGSHY